MLRTSLRMGFAAVLLTSTAGLILAQVAQPQPQIGTTPAVTLRAKQILGAQVSLQGGNAGVGTVEDIVLNGDGVIDFLIVAEGGKLVTVPWEAARFNQER